MLGLVLACALPAAADLSLTLVSTITDGARLPYPVESRHYPESPDLLVVTNRQGGLSVWNTSDPARPIVQLYWPGNFSDHPIANGIEGQDRMGDLLVVTHLGDQCAARWDGAERWRCLFGEYRLPLIRTPYMAIGSQFDSVQLAYDIGYIGRSRHSPATPEEMTFAWQVANETADFARSLAVGQRFIYSSRCHNHAVSLDTPGFVAPGCGGVSLQAALLRFLDAAAPYGSSTPRLELPQLALEQQCNDFDCCCVQSGHGLRVK